MLKAVVLRVGLRGDVVGNIQRQAVQVQAKAAVGSFGGNGSAQVLHIPVGGGFRVGRLEMDMVERECHSDETSGRVVAARFAPDDLPAL